jgi:adenosylcobinamide-GDP ribazoletransferase
MKEQWLLLLTAVMYYTRIPVGVHMPHRADLLSKATRYVPLIGWITGALIALVLYAGSKVLPLPVGIVLALTAGIWITGGFHEDGFADMCDGFGGGWTKERILDIMKDSRIGTFGMLGLLLIMLLKFCCLQSLPLPVAMAAILTAHPLSRLLPVTIIYAYPYVRENDDSKAKPIAKGISGGELALAALFGLAPALLYIFLERQYLLLMIFPLLWLARAYMARLMNRWIGGYTGDCLGALQQVGETVIYLCFCIVEWKFT